MILKHPEFPDVTKDVSDDTAPRWQAAGWVPATADDVDPAPSDDACPTCGSWGEQPCVTASGAETTRHAKRGG